MVEKCYKCGTGLVDDPIGYSPSCAWCPKCKEIRDDNFDREKLNTIHCPQCKKIMDPLYSGSNTAFICKKCRWIREIHTRRPSNCYTCGAKETGIDCKECNEE